MHKHTSVVGLENPLVSVDCERCHKEFFFRKRKFKQRRICDECQRKSTNKAVIKLRRYKIGFAGVSTAKIGAISELRVCADLLNKGFEVFRAVASDATCDLAALKESKLIRVEVRTGYRKALTNGWHYPKPKAGRYDVVAVCDKDGSIAYFPKLKTLL